MRRLMLLTFIASVLFISACQSDTASHRSPEMTGDIREETSSTDVLPTFLAGKSENIQLVYQVAAENRELLEYIPCYCGCGESVGHKSNAECFVHSIDEDGTVVWDDHGTRCGVCVEIAVKSSKMKDEGNDVNEIRKEIEKQYGTGYAEPTPTPMP